LTALGPTKRLLLPMAQASARARVAHVSIVHKARDIRIFHKECRTLAAAGYEVHLLVPSPSERLSDGVHFHAIPSLDGITFFWRALRHLPAIYRDARRLDASIYHLHDPHLIPVGLLLKRAGATVVYDAHEDSPRQAISIYAGRPLHGWLHAFIWSLLERLARRRLDAFVAATPTIGRNFPAAKSVLVRNFPLPEEFSSVLENGHVPYDERPNHAIYVGGITVARGIREMVDMLDLVPDDLGARLTLLGEFPRDRPELEGEVRRRPGWARVSYLGYQPRETVVGELARSRVGLVVLRPLRNYVEALPIKLWEYMAAGIPVIASAFPLWRRIISEAGCGLLVDPTDRRSIADAVAYLLRHPDEAEVMGRRGREAFQSRYNWRAEGTRLVGLYERLGAQFPAR